MMGPFKIRAVLADGKVAVNKGFYLCLDSFMAAAWMRREHPDTFYNANTNALAADDLITPDLPLQKRGAGNEWYFACSVGFYKPAGTFISYWHKRFDKEMEGYLHTKKKTFDAKSGPFKSYRMPLPGDLTESIEWYCYGDKDETLKLLHKITHIGKKRSQGYGLVKEWTVEKIEEDYSEVGPNRELMRPMIELPIATDENTAVRRDHGLRPPYWHNANRLAKWVPMI